MRRYEMMVIVTDTVEEEEATAVMDRVKSVLATQGGTIHDEAWWGKRRFAYEINHKWEGTYAVLEIVTEARDLHDVERMLRLADEVVRHKLMRLPDDEATRRGLSGDAPAATAAAE